MSKMGMRMRMRRGWMTCTWQRQYTVHDHVKDGDEEEDEEGLDDLYLAKTGYMILSKMGMRKRMRRG